MKKHFVFKNDRLEEVRGYRDDDICVERWEIVYDEEERVIGLRPLSPKDVIPQSVLDKIKFWRKPKPLTKILSVDFIGLIQYIGLINKIKKVVTIEEILEILNIKKVVTIEQILEVLNIKKVDVIGEITTIRDLFFTPPTFIVNASFEQGFLGWITYKNPEISTVAGWSGQVCHFPSGTGTANTFVEQFFPIAFDPSWGTIKICLRIANVNHDLRVEYAYHDGTSDYEDLSVSVPNTWVTKTLSPPSNKAIRTLRFRKMLDAAEIWLDQLNMVF